MRYTWWVLVKRQPKYGGGPIPGVRVVLRHKRGRPAYAETTDKKGLVYFRHVEPGEYTLEVYPPKEYEEAKIPVRITASGGSMVFLAKKEDTGLIEEIKKAVEGVIAKIKEQIDSIIDGFKKYPENVPTSEEYESGLEQALKAAGLHDWAKKAHDIRVWLEKNFGVEVAPGRKVIIIPSAGTFSAKLAEDAPKWGVSTAAETLKKAGSAIAGAVTGIAMSKAAHIGLTVAGFGLFIPFIAEEATQAAQFAVFIAKETKDPEVIKRAVDNYKHVLKITDPILEYLSALNPLGYMAFKAFADAAKDNVYVYDKLVEYYKKLKERIEKKKPPEEKGILYIFGYPRGADIYINGKKLDVTTPERLYLDPGEYEVEIKYPRRESYKFKVKIEPGKKIEKRYYLKLIKRRA